MIRLEKLRALQKCYKNSCIFYGTRKIAHCPFSQSFGSGRRATEDITTRERLLVILAQIEFEKMSLSSE